MELEKISLKEVLITVKYCIESAKHVYVGSRINELEYILSRSKATSDELVLLRIIKERLERNNALVDGTIKKVQALHYNNRVKENSSYFKGIDNAKLKRFIKENDFEKPQFGNIEMEIGERYFKAFHNI